MEHLTTLSLAVAVFASTNLDDLLLLTALFAHPRTKPRNIVMGQYLGIAILFVVSAFCAQAAVLVPKEYLALLGFLPILLGIRGLFALREKDDDDDDDEIRENEQRLEKSTHSQILAVAGITIADGGDNLSVYIPTFANDPKVIPVFALAFLFLIGLWCYVAFRIVNNRWIGDHVRRVGRFLLPFLLIAIGASILIDAWVFLL